MLVIYHKILEFSEAYATVGGVPAGPALWLPFVLFIMATYYLFLKTEIVAGATPMQRLEDHWGSWTSAVTKLFRSRHH